jgi:hypothetical protein
MYIENIILNNMFATMNWEYFNMSKSNLYFSSIFQFSIKHK